MGYGSNFDPNRVAHPDVGAGTNALISVFEPDREFRRTDLSRIVRVMGTLEGPGTDAAAIIDAGRSIMDTESQSWYVQPMKMHLPVPVLHLLAP